MKDFWKDDKVQFARLINELELQGVFTHQVVQKLCEEMDVEEDWIDELLERAQTHFDHIKASL